MLAKNVGVIVNSFASGGAEKIALTVAEKISHLDRIGELHLFCIENNDFYMMDSSVVRHVLSGSDGGNGFIYKVLSLLVNSYKLSLLIKKHNIELVQAHMYRSGIVSILPLFFGAKHTVQLVVHGQVGRFLGKNKLLYLLKRAILRCFFSKASLIVFVSKAMRDDFLQRLSVNAGAMVIYNPVRVADIERYMVEAVEDFSFDKEKKYIVMIGRFIPLKRHVDVISSLTLLDDVYELVLIGDGPLRASLEKYAVSCNVSDRVHFLGKKSNPFKYVKHCFVFVLASESEGFPNVIAEAMVCGVPVVASDCLSGPREMLADNYFPKMPLISDDIEVAPRGILYPIGDVGLLVKAIEYCASNACARQDFIRESKIFSSKLEYNDTIRWYEKLFL